MSKGLFSNYMEKLLSFPLWVKQTVFLSLSEELEKYFSSEFLNISSSELFHLHRPILSEAGKNELAFKESRFDENIYSFLDYCAKNMTLVEIAIEKEFTMEEIAKVFVFCSTSGFFSSDSPELVNAVAGFISGKYRTGEYFIRTGKITVEQLDAVLSEQKNMLESGKHVFIAELMIQMGFISDIDAKSIMFMKEEAGRKFSLNPDDIPNIALEKEKFDIRVENTRLTEENEILKKKLDSLLTFIKEHKEQ